MTEPESPKDKLTAGGLGKSISAGMSGEKASFRGILDAVGGVRGSLEAILPGLVFLIAYLITNEARLSAIIAGSLAVLTVLIRLVSRQTLLMAMSGVFGVAIAVAATLLSGQGEDYFLPGFWINGAWILALTISLIVRWPLLGFIVGALRNDLVGWRKNKFIYFAAKVSSFIWLLLFVLRLAIQLPLYFAGNVAALGVARLVMGTPLFALVILFTWLLFRKTLTAEREVEG